VLDGQFRVDRVVGEGGFSVVYQGHHQGLNEPIAIKCLKLPVSLGSSLVDSFIQRFRDESRILYRLSQGNLHIVRSIAAGTTQAPMTGALVPFMVLDWLEGRSLQADFTMRRAAGKTGRSLEEITALFGTAAEALGFAHMQGVVHRDLNAGNLFLTVTQQGETLKVMDFGVAKVMQDSALQLGPRAQTVGQMRIFAPAYGAPEQFDERLGAVGAASDVYALALIMLEAMRDRPVNEADNLGVFAHLALDPQRRPTPRALGIEVPDAVESAFVRATMLDTHARWQTARDFWAAFASGANGMSGARASNERNESASAYGKTVLASRESQPPADATAQYADLTTMPFRVPARTPEQIPAARPAAPPQAPTQAMERSAVKEQAPTRPLDTPTPAVKTTSSRATSQVSRLADSTVNPSQMVTLVPGLSPEPRKLAPPAGSASLAASASASRPNEARGPGTKPSNVNDAQTVVQAPMSTRPTVRVATPPPGAVAPLAPTAPTLTSSQIKSSVASSSSPLTSEPPTPVVGTRKAARQRSRSAADAEEHFIDLDDFDDLLEEDEVTRVHVPEPDVLRKLSDSDQRTARETPPPEEVETPPMIAVDTQTAEAAGVNATYVGWPPPPPPLLIPEADRHEPRESPQQASRRFGNTLALTPVPVGASPQQAPGAQQTPGAPPVRAFSQTVAMPTAGQPAYAPSAPNAMAYQPSPNAPNAMAAPPPHPSEPPPPSTSYPPQYAGSPLQDPRFVPTQSGPMQGQAFGPPPYSMHSVSQDPSAGSWQQNASDAGSLYPPLPAASPAKKSPRLLLVGIIVGLLAVVGLAAIGFVVVTRNDQSNGEPTTSASVAAADTTAGNEAPAPPEPAPAASEAPNAPNATAAPAPTEPAPGASEAPNAPNATAAPAPTEPAPGASEALNAPNATAALAPEPAPAASEPQTATPTTPEEPATPGPAPSEPAPAASPRAKHPAAAPHAAPAGWAKATPQKSTSQPAPPVPVPTNPNAFNEANARARLATANGVLIACKQPGGVTGPGSAAVTFGPDGTVTAISVDSPYAGTKEGECAAGQFRRVRVNAFEGSPQTVVHSFEVPK